jgi:tRNA pseudouridine55 synthase
MFGLLNIDKPAGMTSRDVVNRVQRLVKPHKVGHAGTLDPLATGVLVVAVGPATRLVEYIQRMPKTYQGTFLLGRTSDTEDIEGKVGLLDAPPVPAREQIEAVIPAFLGAIEQRPPAFSALKISGRPAYKLARRGEAVELARRKIEVYEIKIASYEYPQLELLVRCGSGTYIRSLGRDIALALGTGAVMSALRRQAIGPFRVEEAIALDALSPAVIQERLLSAALAVASMPQLVVTASETARLVRGQSIVNRAGPEENEVAAIDEAGTLMAILKSVDQSKLRPEKCFVNTEG